MRSSPHIVTFGITLATLAYANPFDLPPDFHRFSPPSLNITWAPCAEGSNKECGRFEVPLDYQNATAGKASIAVARYPAAKQPKLGTLFFNPGGPGASGVEVVLDPLADQIMAASGGRFDVVSWDPRGVGLSLPYLACFANATEESAFWEGTIPYVGLEARSNFTSRSDLDAFYAQVPEVDELLVELGQRCLEYTPDSFQYVGTAAVVRDMVTLHDYLEGPEKPLNYWGFSYGTAIGIYFVNMFPNRVGRVVLDGVVDPIYWANRPAHEIWSIDVESADEALTGFVSACAAAGPENCAIASKNSTADSLREEIRQLIDDVYDYRQTHGPGAKIPSSANVRCTFSKPLLYHAHIEGMNFEPRRTDGAHLV
ncbi:hypothetical protein FRC08_006558 [Ceratobasidium sp. 394]|nr:hypothetical protein FRC08_006558 [Ceratobasidium sp. 394]